MQTGLLPEPHDGNITDGAYDFYGLRLATCSADQHIKFWESDEDSGTWSLQDEWKAHEARICSLAWAHPEYGTLFATGSFDCTTRVWARRSPAGGVAHYDTGDSQTFGDSQYSSRWHQAAVLMEARGTTRCVSFAPPLYGLKLATLSTDGFLRIYDGSDRGTQWIIRTELDLTIFSSPIGTLAVLDGASSALAGASPLLGPPTSVTSSGTVTPGGMSTASFAMTAPKSSGRVEADGGWSLSWCRDRWQGGLLLAVVSGRSNSVRILHIAAGRRAQPILTLEARKPSSFALASVDWAPSVGRTHHRVAAGGRDGSLHIWQLTPKDGFDGTSSDDADAGWTVETWSFDDHRPFGITKVEWNITGTVLASSAYDGRVRLWKRTDGKIWRGQGYVTGETHDLYEVEVLDQPDDSPQDNPNGR
ncbi:WD40 repeat-like protein [Auriculariales sp. MPI-PUGE-AT-0066]|nr:WD40 repeat-like protein [Auriculariales sp. MPI-PUGE-AT-0066]